MANPFDDIRIDMEGRAAPSKPSHANLRGWIAAGTTVPKSRPLPHSGGRSVFGAVVPGGVDLRGFYPDLCRVCPKQTADAFHQSPQPYTHVPERLVLDPDRVLFVGDSVRADIEGPCKVGMKARHIKDIVSEI